jgi:hypothetical protein
MGVPLYLRLRTSKKKLQSISFLCSLAALILLSLCPLSARAQEAQPGDACAAGEAGWYRNSSMTTATDGGNMMFCDGSTWESFIVYKSSGDLILGQTGAVTLPAGTDAQRPSPATGMIRFSTTSSAFEGYDGSTWGGFGGDINSVTGEPAPTYSFVLNDLTNVTAGLPSGGECLTWSGSAWVNGICGTGVDSVTGEPAPTYNFLLNDITDVNAGSPNDTDVLSWDSATSKWIPQAAGTSSLWTAGTGDDIYYNSGTPFVGIGQTNPDATLDVTGDIEYTGTITEMSDRRLKTDIADLPEGQLARITALQGVSFKMKDNPNAPTELGFIAQDVRPHYPDLVFQRREGGMLSLNYTGLIAPMVEAIKEQQSQIEAQQKQIDSLVARVEALEAKE